MQSLSFPLILLRHGAAEMPKNTCVGQLDVPLTHRGRQAIATLSRQWPCDVPTRIYCSDLQRARDSAAEIADALNLPVCEDKRLREVDFGEWEGQHWDSIHEADPLLMKQWGNDWVNTAPPLGENVLQLFERVTRFFTEITREPPQPTLIVAHAGSLRALLCVLNDRPMDALFTFDIPHATHITLS